MKPCRILVGACLLYSLTTAPAAVPILFTNVQTWPDTNDDHTVVACMDLNHDGRDDIVTWHRVFLSTADGTLTKSFDFPSGQYVARLVDVDGDGEPCVFIKNGSLWKSQGDGTFFLRTNLSAGGGYCRLGDFNGDGKDDLCFAFTGDRIEIWTNTGTGTFQKVPVTTAISSISINACCVADFDGDGVSDVAFATEETTLRPDFISVFRGKTNGTFYPEVRFSPFTNDTHNSMYVHYPVFATGDFNADGIVDLVVSGNYLTKVAVLLGSKTNLFREPILSGTNSIYLASSEVSCAADMDGDGILDLIGRSAVWRGHGDGSFSAGEYVCEIYGGAPRSSVGDLDGDGRPDYFVFGFKDGVGMVAAVYRNQTTATSNRPNIGMAWTSASMVLTWPRTNNGFFTLQENTDVADTNGWHRVAVPPAALGSRFYVTNSAASGSKFYRLVGP